MSITHVGREMMVGRYQGGTLLKIRESYREASLVAQAVKNSCANAGDPGLTPGSKRSPGERNGTPLQYSCLKNPMDREAWQATVHGVAKSWTRLSLHAHIHTHTPTHKVAEQKDGKKLAL